MRRKILALLLCLSCFAAAPALGGLTASPNPSTTGSYTVTWTSPHSGVFLYTLRESTNGGSTWVSYTANGSTYSKAFVSKPSGTYLYQLDYCYFIYIGGEPIDFCATAGGGSPWNITETVLANVTAPITVLPTSAVGALPFSSQVSDVGDAQVTVPLQLPAGVNGLAPALSLEYASGGGRAAMDAEQVQGVLGYGWGLRGISEIRRCRIGIGGAIALNTTDRLCLDNQPLVRINTGSYWADGGEYRTEKQSFIQLVSQGVGIANWSFDVHLPNGHVRTYGNTTASRITPPNNTTPYLWTLTTETDDFNNVLSVTWIKNSAAGLNFPQRISYGSAVVDFYYEERTDTSGQLSNMVPGVLYRAVALNRIFVRMNGVSVRDYRLEQTTITDTQSNPPKDYRLLNQVQLCGYDASGSSASCLQPVSFAWMTPVGTPTAFGQVVNGITASTGETTTFLYYTLPGSGSGNHTLHRDPITWFGTYVAPSTVATISDARVVVQEYNPPDGIGGHQQFKYYYTGYPLYNTQGRGFVGFPSTQVDQYKIPTFDRATSTSIDQREITYLQHRLTFPFIGKISRVYQQIYAEGSWKNTLRRMIGWGSKTFFSGTVTFPFVERSYDRPLVVNATNGQNSLSATESVRSYCFRTLDGNGNCPTSGTEGETPTQLMRVNKTGISLSTQTFSGEWGNVLARTVNSVTHYADQSADFTNTVTGSNWAIGFVNQLTSHQGVTAPTLTQNRPVHPERQSLARGGHGASLSR